MLVVAFTSLAMSVSQVPPGPSRGIEAAAPQHQAAKDLIEVLGAPAQIEGFVASRFSAAAQDETPSDRLKRLKALAAQSGGVDVTGWHPDGPHIFFEGKTRNSSLPVDGMIMIRDGKIAAFEMQRDIRARPPGAPAWPLTAASPDEAVRKIAEEIAGRADAERFSGAVLIAHRGQPVLHRAYGAARRLPDVANQTSTLFHTASATKMLTSAAIAKLVDEGKLSFDTTVAKAVPSFANSPGAAQATIRDLLGHRVSYGEYFEEKKARGPELARHTRATEVLDLLLAGREPERAPKGRINYSNANYLVLAAAVEAAAGRSFYDYVQGEVLTPLGMHATTYATENRLPRAAAIGWIKDDVGDPLALGPWLPNDHVLAGNYRGGPAGGVWSTAEDMWRLLDGLAAGKLIKRDTLDAMIGDRVRMGPTLGSAAGFMTRGGEMTRYFGHSGGGGNAGMSAAAFISPDREWAVVVLSNFSSPSGEMLGGQILDFLAKLPR